MQDIVVCSASFSKPTLTKVTGKVARVGTYTIIALAPLLKAT
jgi:hypothetical protein